MKPTRYWLRPLLGLTLASGLAACGSGGEAADDTPPPTVTITSALSSLTLGAATTLTWSSTNATACAASGGWSGPRATFGTEANTPATAGPVSYTLTCTGSGGSTSATATVAVASPPAPTVSLAAAPATVIAGTATTLSWSSTNATDCTASGAWTGNRPVSGSESQTPAAIGNAVYTLICAGAAGSGEASTQVLVVSPVTSLSLSVPPGEVMPADEVLLTLSASNGLPVDPAQIALHVDLGQGIVADLPFTPVPPDKIRIIAPAGRFSSERLELDRGTVILTAAPLTERTDVHASDPVPLEIGTLQMPNMRPGDLTRVYLRAVRLLLLDSIANLALLDARVEPLNSNTVSMLTQQHNRQIDLIEQTIAAIMRAQAGESVTVGQLENAPLTLTTDSLPALDRQTFAAFRIVPVALTAKPAIFSTKAKAAELGTDDDLGFEIRGLANETALSSRNIAGRVRSLATTTLSVVGAGALLFAAPEIAVAATGLAAVTWFATTAAGTAIGLSLQAGTSSILDGQASEQDFRATEEFVLSSYLELAQSYVTGNALESALGETWGGVVSAGLDVASTTTDFLNTEVEPAFASDAIPTEGFPASTFSLSVSANLSIPEYQVTAVIAPASSGIPVQIQVSGTDGFRGTFNATSAADGSATVNVPAGLPGVRDSISAFDPNGRAISSTSITF